MGGLAAVNKVRGLNGMDGVASLSTSRIYPGNYETTEHQSEGLPPQKKLSIGSTFLVMVQFLYPSLPMISVFLQMGAEG